jgi:mannose-1-phosphate guanylyltransferase
MRFEADRRDDVAAVMLARGHGRQIDPRQHAFRHPLLPVALTPLIKYPLAWLADSGVTSRVVISAQDVTDAVRAWARTESFGGLSINYWADPYPRGPAGTLKDAARLVPADRYVVVEGARLPQIDLREVLRSHRASGAAATMVVETERRRKAGVRERVPGGLYVFEHEALDLVPPSGFQDIKQGLLELVQRAGLGVHAYERSGLTPTVVDFATFGAVSRWLVETLADRTDQYAGFLPIGDGLRHPSAHVASDVTIVGPVLIGAGARIDAQAVLVGPAVIGNDAVVGTHATVSRSILLDGARVGDWAQVDGSVLLANAVVGGRASVEDRVVGLARPTVRRGMRAVAVASFRSAWPSTAMR